MGLRDIGASLPPGFRFYPSDEELVCHYLYKKINVHEADALFRATSLVEIDLHTCEPWQLPEVAKLNANEWYFFSFRDRKYATGYRTNRATTSGYWKATGKDRVILDPNTREIVGMRKTLVFYKNRAPNGIKTGWIMHEFRLETPHMPPKEDWVLCRVFHKSKGEDNIIIQNQHMFDTTIATAATTTATASSPPPLAPSSPPDHHHSGFSISSPSLQTLTTHNYQNDNSSNNSTNNNGLNLTLLNPNFLQFIKGSENPNPLDELIGIKENDHHQQLDDYGYLFDMNLGDMGFEDDNGIIFL